MAEIPVQTNKEIGRRIGMGHTGVSRIRSGDRYPSRGAMKRIALALDWPVGEQMALLPEEGRNLDYAMEFERRLSQGVRSEDA